MDAGKKVVLDKCWELIGEFAAAGFMDGDQESLVFGSGLRSVWPDFLAFCVANLDADQEAQFNDMVAAAGWTRDPGGPLTGEDLAERAAEVHAKIYASRPVLFVAKLVEPLTDDTTGETILSAGTLVRIDEIEQVDEGLFFWWFNFGVERYCIHGEMDAVRATAADLQAPGVI